jgi:hypothetical protein
MPLFYPGVKKNVQRSNFGLLFGFRLGVQLTVYDTYEMHFGIASLIVIKDLPETLCT